MARNSFLSEGTFGWSGLFGTHFWIDPEREAHRRSDDADVDPGFPRDFENAVTQSVVGGTAPRSTGTN